MSPVVAVVPDLFFATRLQATARATGTELALVPAAQALERCAGEPPVRVLLDLHAAGALALARALKADPRTERIPLVGFYSHVDTVLRTEALAAGVDEVLPRSAFVARLPALLADAAAPPPSP